MTQGGRQLAVIAYIVTQGTSQMTLGGVLCGVTDGSEQGIINIRVLHHLSLDSFQF
jgi:hypothetical protein